MPISVDVTAPGHALDALAGAVNRAKAGRLLAPVTVIVPTNTAGVMARRALGRLGGATARAALERARRHEPSAEARTELDAALAG